jgi:hypothetical protein
MNTGISIINLDKHDNEWSWDQKGIEYIFPDDMYTHFHTNQGGEGLFRGYGYSNQQTGTGQFSLRGCSKSAAYNRIKRYFAD